MRVSLHIPADIVAETHYFQLICFPFWSLVTDGCPSIEDFRFCHAGEMPRHFGFSVMDNGSTKTMTPNDIVTTGPIQTSG